jgi:hypothetical protein
LPSALTKPQLLDRYSSHTMHCASCRGALANLKRIRLGLAVIAAIAWSVVPILMMVSHITMPALAIFASLFALGLLGGWAALGRLERRFYEGREIPPRNLPEKRKNTLNRK